FDAIAVQEDEIRGTDNVFFWNDAAAITGADKKPPAVAGSLLDALNQLVNALRLEDVVVVTDVALIVDLDEDVAIAVIEKPVDGVVHTALDCLLIGEPLT